MTSMCRSQQTQEDLSFIPARAVELADNLIASFDSNRTTPSTHAENFIEERGIKEEAFCTFLREIFFGIERDKRCLKIILNGLYTQNAGQTNLNDYNLYIIFAYLIIFRLNEMGFLQIRRFLKSVDKAKIIILLDFIFESLDEWLPTQLSVVYDYIYVEERIIRVLRDHKDAFVELKEQFEEATVGPEVIAQVRAPKKMKSKFQATVPVPFNITKTHPRVLPLPKIKVYTEPCPPSKVPKFKNSLAMIEAEKLKRRNEIREQKIRALESYSPPKLGEANKERFKRALEEKERTILNSMESGHKARPAPKVHPQKAFIRMNTTAILREDALFRKKQSKEAKMIKEYEMSLRDQQDFDEWKEKELEEEARWEEKIRLQRKDELERSAIIAKQAQEVVLEKRKQEVRKQRSERRELEVMKKEEEELEIEANRIRVKDVHDLQTYIDKARHKVVKEAKKSAQEIYEARIMYKEVAEQQRLADLEEKKQLIREIQAMEEVAKIRAKEPKVFDPTVPSGVGLLCEMSMAELREQAEFHRTTLALDVQNKRETIVRRKQEKADMIQSKAAHIEKFRRLKKVGGDEIRSRTKALEEKTGKDAKIKYATQMKELEKRLTLKQETKRKEAMKLAQEISETRLLTQMASATKSELDTKRWKGINKGIERDARNRERAAKIERHKRENILDRQKRIRQMNMKKADKRPFYKKYERDLKKNKEAGHAKSNVDAKMTKDKVKGMHDEYNSTVQERKMTKTFAKRKSQRKLTR